MAAIWSCGCRIRVSPCASRSPIPSAAPGRSRATARAAIVPKGESAPRCCRCRSRRCARSRTSSRILRPRASSASRIWRHGRARPSRRASAKAWCCGSIRRSATSMSRSRRACRCRRRWRSSVFTNRSRARPTCSAPPRIWRASLSRILERRGEGARLVQLALFRTDGKVHRLEIGTGAPLRDPARMRKLFEERLAVLGDACDPGFGYDMVRLSALVTERTDPVQTGLSQPDHAEEMAHLIDRLGARFGLSRVTRQVPQNTHIPEFAVASVPAHAQNVTRNVTDRRRRRARHRTGQPCAGQPRTGAAGPAVVAAGADRGDAASAGRSADQIQMAARAASCRSCRRPRAHRDGMVAQRSRREAHPRLLPCRMRRGRAGLALSRRTLRARGRDAALSAMVLHELFA